MELDPDIRSFIAESDRIFGADYDALRLAGRRQVYADWCRAYSPPDTGETLRSEIRVPGWGGGIRALLQQPQASSVTGKLPVVVYCHGGGWIMGSPETHAGITAALARDARVAVLSIDYRLAPEQPFPAAFDDAYAACVWAASEGAALGLDPDRLAVAGDSAGGNLAAAVALAARDRGGPKIAFQALLYPFLKAGGRTALDDPNAGTEAGMAGFLAAYAGKAEIAANPYAMPLAARDFSRLPPAFIGAAAIDLLCEDAEDYAAALRSAGVAVEHRRAAGLTHSYLRCIHFSRAAYLEFGALCAALGRAFGRNDAGHDLEDNLGRDEHQES